MFRSGPAFEAIHRDAFRALELLHGLDLVFGDPQEFNALYFPDEGRALLVDFDEVGPEDAESLERLMEWLSGEL